MVPTRGGMPRFAPSRCGVAVGAHIPPGGGITSGVVPKRTRVAGFPQLLVAALLAAECSEPVGPERHAPVAADVTPAATGIALDQLNGGVGQSGNVFIKGFNPTNPHLGDAIVATFFWLGSTNIIDSVTDVLTTTPYTPVGNTYTLVEYVTAGGISMATYVATNVQNFPYPNTSDAQVLAVRANLSQSVTDGMELLSAWSGVGGVSTAHRSATGSGSSYPTTADPGPITLGAGDLAYAVTMSNGLVGRDPPPAPFGTLAIQSDAHLVDEADTVVLVSGGSVDPRWNWYFNSPSTWLASVLALNPGTAPAPGNLTVTVDGTTSQPIATNNSTGITFTGLAAGSHSVALSGVAANCTVTSANPQTVTVPSGGTVTAAFSVSCTATPGNLTVTTSTGGSNLDPDGYTVTVDGTTSQPIATNNSTGITFTGLAAGSHSVALSGVAANCTVSGGNPQTVTVPSGGTVTAAFTVTCTTPPGNLTVTTSTGGSSLDPDGYTVTVDGTTSQPIAINNSTAGTTTTLPAGGQSAALTGVAASW